MSDLALAGTPELANPPRDEAGSAQHLERKLLVALGGAVLLAVSLLAQYFDVHHDVAQLPAALGAIIIAIPLLTGAWREINRGRPGSDSLACIAIGAAFANESYLAAGFLAFCLWFANLILSRTAWGAQRAIRDLIDLTPDVARVV